jgi:hypothetical protein
MKERSEDKENRTGCVAEGDWADVLIKGSTLNHTHSHKRRHTHTIQRETVDAGTGQISFQLQFGTAANNLNCSQN